MKALPPVPHATLSSGASIPLLGLGTWKSEPNKVKEAVKFAVLEAGYRHLDLAFIYQNEHEVGEALREIFATPGAPKREELFITSKLWNTFHRGDLVIPACKSTLENLGLSYLDLYLIHWPCSFVTDKGIWPTDSSGNVLLEEVPTKETWEMMEELVQMGLVKSIGVSNFVIAECEDLLSYAKIKPAVNQVELHPYLPQKKLLEYCRSKNIHVTAYSPLGSPDSQKEDAPRIMKDPVVVAIAEKHKKFPAQILIRWALQRAPDCSVIPKSVTPSNIAANIAMFDFSLDEDDMARLDSLGARGHRFVDPPFWKLGDSGN
eukprot:CAMPEP_0196655044 /NCGR_PEP_ID=MMETSP1086-20130531/4801_1 /TAXON_ID=77921 /ORGANISM="Cyanoptyche  gloeocystis , Strain SAG4.97" /LENGTH=317 /DNA_ID=CAMNT_0041987145 /DNA_START=53 /DNA_END=1006 /DNA_ORIENTATION=-